MPKSKYEVVLDLIDSWVDSEKRDFATMSKDVEHFLSEIETEEMVRVVEEIGIIPEKYDHDSTHEKLYAKMSDCVVSYVLKTLGFETRVLVERGDSADVIARSKWHGYDLVADAKVFRLSRTAKNQKDFKINSMDKWRGECDYALLVCPLYQYPSTASAIYAQVLDTEVALTSFEHLLFCLSRGVRESSSLSLEKLFSYPSVVSSSVVHSERKKAKPVFDALDAVVAERCDSSLSDLSSFKATCMGSVSRRAQVERKFWVDEMKNISAMSVEEAREALIESRKIRSKIESISEFIL